jgi:hypothetical protein
MFQLSDFKARDMWYEVSYAYFDNRVHVRFVLKLFVPRLLVHKLAIHIQQVQNDLMLILFAV